MRQAMTSLVLVLASSSADAQTAANTGLIVAPNGQCLTLEGKGTESHPPRSGTRVVLDRWNGRPTQRWTVFGGDYNYTRGLGDLCLEVAGTTKGPLSLVGVACEGAHSGVTLSGHELRLTSGEDPGCIALATKSAGATLSLQSCHESPEQHWEFR